MNPKQPSDRPGGFSLVELLVVIVLIGLLAALAVPSFDGYITRQKTRSALDKLVNDATLARITAVRQGKQTQVAIDVGGRGFRVDTTGATGGFVAMKTVDLRDNHAGVTLSGPAAIQFNSRGMLVSPSTVFFRAAGHGLRDSVEVSAAGRISRAY